MQLEQMTGYQPRVTQERQTTYFVVGDLEGLSASPLYSGDLYCCDLYCCHTNLGGCPDFLKPLNKNRKFKGKLGKFKDSALEGMPEEYLPHSIKILKEIERRTIK